MPHASRRRAPGNAFASSGPRIPEDGRLGSASPAGMGIASVLPLVVSEFGASPTYKNFPSGAHATGQQQLQIRREEPPPIGIAIVAPSFGNGTPAITQRRSGET